MTYPQNPKAQAQAIALMLHDAVVRVDHKAQLLAGVDEVGRGSLAGPLVAAAVVMPDRYLIPGLNDSKLLSPAARHTVAQLVTRAAICWAVAFVPASYIDTAGLTAANMDAMRQAVHGLQVRPDLVISDGYPVQKLELPNLSLVKGDRKSQVVAAAACLAKVVRDTWMACMGEERYPGYGWERNAGYATAEHQRAVAALGITPQHRRLFLRGLLDTKSVPVAKPEQVALPLSADSPA